MPYRTCSQCLYSKNWVSYGALRTDCDHPVTANDMWRIIIVGASRDVQAPARYCDTFKLRDDELDLNFDESERDDSELDFDESELDPIEPTV